jgi:hypothetical protein
MELVESQGAAIVYLERAVSYWFGTTTSEDTYGHFTVLQDEVR